MTDEEYRNIEALSASGMHALSKSPAHYQVWKNNPSDSTAAMEMGTAVHMVILEYHKFLETYVENRSTENDTPAQKAAATKLLKKQYPDRKILSSADYNRVLEMRSAILANRMAIELLTCCHYEQIMQWDDQISGAACKGKLDILGAGYVADIKTTTDAKAFQFTVKKYFLHRQAAFYYDGAKAREFYWIVVEKNAPYAVMVYKASNSLLKEGRESYRPLARLYKFCTDNNEWPGYGNEVIELDGDSEGDVSDYTGHDWPF